MTKDLLLNKNMVEMYNFVEAHGQPTYRAHQLLEWIYQKRATSFDELTNLPRKWRTELQETSTLTPFRSSSVQISTDQTRKYLFELHDGACIESVCIPMKEHFTLCISTQAGCALQCAFCLTGKRFSRNVQAGEILGQILAVQRDHPPDSRISNIVLMGMGEPLLNYEQTVKAIRMMLSENGLNFSHRKITLSTAGIVPGIVKLGQEDFTINLAISLNAATDPLRSNLMPINKTYPLEQLLQACREYPLPERCRITFEYILLDQINDSPSQARALARLLRGIRCKINLIPLNPIPGTPYLPSPEDAVLLFQKILLEQGYSTFIRASKGADISAACGQLRGSITGNR
jgi:23S rRNA (adenine2503-C2)-methyltransferase